jgi:hypothetical protein
VLGKKQNHRVKWKRILRLDGARNFLPGVEWLFPAKSSVLRGNPTPAGLTSKNVQLDAQVLLGIFPDCLDQALSFLQHLVRIVVEGVILE